MVAIVSHNDSDEPADDPWGGIERYCASCGTQLTPDNSVELQMGARGFPPIAPDCEGCFYDEPDDHDPDPDPEPEQSEQAQVTLHEALLDDQQDTLRE